MGGLLPKMSEEWNGHETLPEKTMTKTRFKKSLKKKKNNYLKTLEKFQNQTEVEGKFNFKNLPQEGVRIESLCLPGLRVMPNSYSYSYKKIAVENHSLPS